MVKESGVVGRSGWRGKGWKEGWFMGGVWDWIVCKDREEFSGGCVCGDEGVDDEVGKGCGVNGVNREG